MSQNAHRMGPGVGMSTDAVGELPPVGAHRSARSTGSAFERFTGPQGLAYQPGLDGLRGLAVGAVVLFHLGFGGVTGGYLGVSMFFTLSGVLIGSLVLNEIATSGGFSLRQFWLRRARRLLPPALVTLAVIAIARHVTTTLQATSGGDVVAAALNVANWHFLAEGASYGELFGGPSAVLHFWSLAIEEQFYLAAGLLSVALATRASRPARTVGVVAAVVATCSFATPFVVDLGVDRVYYGTDTRAGELMLGVAAAAVFASEARRRVILRHASRLAPLAALALAVTVTLWSTATPGTDALRNGLLPLTALLSVAVISGALLPAGPVSAIASLPPLRWLGRISYAVYLVHWPVIVVANEVTDDRSLLRAGALVAISVALAQFSAVFVERPVRRQRLHVGYLAAAASLAVVSIGTASAVDGRTTDSADLLERLSDESVPPQGPAFAQPGAADGPRIALFGDSVGFSMLLALGQSTAVPEFVRAPSDVNLGCGIAVSPSPPPDQPHACDNPADRFALKAVAGDVDVAIMISCQWELLPQAIPGTDEEVTIGDPEMDGYIRGQYERIADRLIEAGVAHVLWMTCPYMSMETGFDALAPRFAASRNPDRIDRLNAIITAVADSRDGVEVLPFSDWVNERRDDPALRPDGSHYEFKAHNPAADAFIELLNETLEGTGS